MGSGSTPKIESFDHVVGEVLDYAIIRLDTDGIIQTWNRGAERVKGYTAEEAIGCSFEAFYPEEDRRSGLPQKLLAEAADSGRVEHEGWRVRKDGSQFWGDVVITALHDDTGNLTGYAKVTRDRTDLKSLEVAQDAFYAAFSHDFRTPITALKGFVDAIRDAADDDEREHLIQRVEASADRLLGMVEGLVQFATHRAERAALMLADIDIARVVRGAVHDLPDHIQPERVHVSSEVSIAWISGKSDALDAARRSAILPRSASTVFEISAFFSGSESVPWQEEQEMSSFAFSDSPYLRDRAVALFPA